MRPRERPQARPLDGDARLLTDHVPVVARRDVAATSSGLELERCPVLEHDPEATREDDADMPCLAPLATHVRLDVRRPPPPPLRDRATYGQLAEIDELDHTGQPDRLIRLP